MEVRFLKQRIAIKTELTYTRPAWVVVRASYPVWSSRSSLIVAYLSYYNMMRL